MTRTILVHIQTDDPSPAEMEMLAQEVHDACERAGLPVEKAVPWNPPAIPTTPLGAVAIPPLTP